MVIPLLVVGIPLAIKHGPKVVKGGIKAYDVVSEHMNKRKMRKTQEAGLQDPGQDIGDPRGHVYDEESSDFGDERPQDCPSLKKRRWRRG
jgi:hypothetical protein